MSTRPEPYLEGSHGRAWKRTPIQSTLVSDYIVEAKWAHPLWSLYNLGAMHLREVPGVEPAIIHLSGATHQVYLFAINPDWELTLEGRVAPLFPPNFMSQMVCVDDNEADRRVEQAAQQIVEGILNPDTDAIHQWLALFGDNMLRR